MKNQIFTGPYYYGMKDLDVFKKTFIDENRGKPLFLIRFENISHIEINPFLDLLRGEFYSCLDLEDISFGFHYYEKKGILLMGIAPLFEWNIEKFPNIENSVGKFQQECIRTKIAVFHFGVSRTQSNFISTSDEIFEELFKSSEKNLNDNLVRWSWTYYNKANTYISGSVHEAMIQPTVIYNPKTKIYSVKGGEVFVGGGAYFGYKDLINDIPNDQDINRIELLILEKLIIACDGAPGLLKFNISPQSLIDTFSSKEKVDKLNKLIRNKNLLTENVRFELVEKPYDDSQHSLKDVCQAFYDHGMSFAADDFGVKSQSHQIVLDLGIMIKEFKLDPISFKFKIEEDQIKFLDNLAFIDYCKRLADNREAVITAEAVEDFDTLRFLMEHQIYQFQANILFGKMPVSDYRRDFELLQTIPEDVVKEVLNDKILSEKQKQHGNVFRVALEAGLI
ncbi:cyclic diguanylate phosphodiesterase (EAL) domain / EAL-domain associated signaling protein domain multi-domain protein [Leptospira ryugenii]|uniref:Cyclic diguanylate phosphodiesterase (EAL) domain / EAL-domain associated signaling protein domain multi-domain protein n=2 Tax=Leptospira ryugenii TaxID=1917863 RepID=A0A2P2E344_9LEPT|nr:cyclic diguanylate phosphodiesterase (EAL) domain / EAL-domain associated signaling protein domain multi-domain protein [Leptospira ryugenii]